MHLNPTTLALPGLSHRQVVLMLLLQLLMSRHQLHVLAPLNISSLVGVEGLELLLESIVLVTKLTRS